MSESLLSKSSEQNDWNEAHPLRNVSLKDIETTIAKALSELVCSELKVSVEKIDFTKKIAGFYCADAQVKLSINHSQN